MKTPKTKFLSAIAFLFVSLSFSQAQIITNFGTNAQNGGAWTYNSGSSTITGTESLGDLLFGGTSFLNYSGAIQFSLTATATTAPTGSFNLSLEDNTGKVASASFFWSDFTGGATVNAPILFQSGFALNNVVGWSLDSGGSGQAINVTLSSASAVIPEPTTMALFAASLTAVMVLRRRRNS